MTDLVQIADRVLNRPLLITPDKASVILGVLSGRIGINPPDASRFEGSPDSRDADGQMRRKPYNVSGDVAIITITGSLVNRGAWIGANSGLTSYEGIQHQIKRAAADDSIRSVILDIHSPGGEAVGAFETGEMVRRLASKKRTVAVSNGLMASAAYAIGSGASEIVTTATGLTGSIGVVVLHADMSKRLEDDGIDPTLIFAGAHKVDGNPFGPLPDSVREDLQAEVNAFYDLFLATVAEGRGKRLTADMARATEARTMIGQKAVDAGLADQVGTFEAVLEDLKSPSGARSGRSNVQKRSVSMDTETEVPGASAASGISQEDHDKAVKAAHESGFTAGVKAENARILAIEEQTPAGHAELLAQHKADTTMTPEKSAVAVLKAEKAKPANPRQTLENLDKAAAGVESRPSAQGDGGSATPKATTPDGWKAEWEASQDLQAEYPTADAYVATMKRESTRSAA
jgi:signal peptide peptidase SppA